MPSLGNVTAHRRLVVHRHVLVEHPHREGKISMPSHLVGALRIMSIDSLPEACVSLMTFYTIFWSMAPRRVLPFSICSGASNPVSLITTQFLVRVEPNTPLLCVPRSQRTSLGQPAQRVQPCTKARKHACDDGEPRVSDSLTIHA